MKFVAEKSALDRICSFVCPIADAKLNIPIIGCVKITVAERVSMTATDLDTEATGTLKANVSTPGTVCVNAALFRNLVRCAPDGSQIEVELKNETVFVRAGRSVAKLSVLPVDSFPTRDLSRPHSSFKISGAEFSDLLGRVLFAVSSDRATQHYICGVNLSVRGANLMAQATDAKVLARAVIEKPEEIADLAITIPTSACTVIQKITDACELPLTISIGETLIAASAGDFSASSRLIDGNFPDCDRIIPDGGTIILADCAEISAALSKLSRLIEQASDKARDCVVTFSENRAEIVGRLPAGEFRDEIEVRYRGDPLRVCFNINNILDSVSAVTASEVELRGSEMAPWVVRGHKDDSGSLTVCSARRG